MELFTDQRVNGEVDIKGLQKLGRREFPNPNFAAERRRPTVS